MIDAEVDDIFVLAVLFGKFVVLLAVLDVLVDALVDQNVCKVVIGCYVEILSSPESVCQTLVIIAQIKVQFGQ